MDFCAFVRDNYFCCCWSVMLSFCSVTVACCLKNVNKASFRWREFCCLLPDVYLLDALLKFDLGRVAFHLMREWKIIVDFWMAQAVRLVAVSGFLWKVIHKSCPSITIVLS